MYCVLLWRVIFFMCIQMGFFIVNPLALCAESSQVACGVPVTFCSALRPAAAGRHEVLESLAPEWSMWS